MSITLTGGVLVEVEPLQNDRAKNTGVHRDDGFAICDELDPIKQIKFDASNIATNTTVTIAAPASTASETITLPSATDGVGAKNGATVSVSESVGMGGIMHKTVLTLASTPVAVASVTTGNGVAGTKIYDFPEGHIKMLGCVANLSIAVDAAKQADFTDNTPEGDIGIGSVAMANADSMGTDATDDDMATAAAFTMTAFEDASVVLPPEAEKNFDGTGTALDAYVNVLVDAADIDDGVTSAVEVSGTVTFHWMNLGDY